MACKPKPAPAKKAPAKKGRSTQRGGGSGEEK